MPLWLADLIHRVCKRICAIILIVPKEALHLLNQTDFGKRFSVCRKMDRVAMGNSALDHAIPQK